MIRQVCWSRFALLFRANLPVEPANILNSSLMNRLFFIPKIYISVTVPAALMTVCKQSLKATKKDNGGKKCTL